MASEVMRGPVRVVGRLQGNGEVPSVILRATKEPERVHRDRLRRHRVISNFYNAVIVVPLSKTYLRAASRGHSRSAPSGRVASIYKHLPRFTGPRNEDRANFGATRPFVREILHASS